MNDMPQKFQNWFRSKKMGTDFNNNINLSKADVKMSGIDPKRDANINKNLIIHLDKNFNVNVNQNLNKKLNSNLNVNLDKNFKENLDININPNLNKGIDKDFNVNNLDTNWNTNLNVKFDIKDRFINSKEETKNVKYFLTGIIQTINKGQIIYIDKVKNRPEIKVIVTLLPSDNIDAKRTEIKTNGNLYILNVEGPNIPGINSDINFNVPKDNIDISGPNINHKWTHMEICLIIILMPKVLISALI